MQAGSGQGTITTAPSYSNQIVPPAFKSGAAWSARKKMRGRSAVGRRVAAPVSTLTGGTEFRGGRP